MERGNPRGPSEGLQRPGGGFLLQDDVSNIFVRRSRATGGQCCRREGTSQDEAQTSEVASRRPYGAARSDDGGGEGHGVQEFAGTLCIRNAEDEEDEG